MIYINNRNEVTNIFVSAVLPVWAHSMLYA